MPAANIKSQKSLVEQTNPKVIELLGEVENIMDEATEMLIEHDTGGKTIAAQTEIIEKIHAAVWIYMLSPYRWVRPLA